MRTGSRLRILVRSFTAIAAAGLVAWASGCVTNPATGENEFSLLSRADEIQLGTQGDAEIVAQYGLYDDAAVTRYVDSLGQVIAARSDDPTLVWTFRVLDSPVINAFALPGGFVYVTRGLLAHVQDEAQLAVVLGHEIGHVTARHTARRYTSGQLASLGVGLGSVLFEDVRPFLGEIQTGLGLLFLKFSRDDESQADELGVKYAAKLGYRVEDAAKFFETLNRLQQKQGGSIPTWASTHPDPADRSQHVLAHAQKYHQQFPAAVLIGGDPEAFVPRFRDIVFGADPRQGYVSGDMFYHPTLRFQFRVPSGWAVENSNTQVQLAPNVAQPTAGMVLTASEGNDPQAVATAFATDNKAQVVSSSQAVVNGLTAWKMVSVIRLEDGSSLEALSYFIRKQTPAGWFIFAFHGYTAQDLYAGMSDTFNATAITFNEVTDPAVLARVPYRLDVFKAPRTDQFGSLVQPNAAAGVELLDLAIMNQREIADQVSAGVSLKQVK